MRGGDRGQTWASHAPGSYPTAPAPPRAPAVGRSFRAAPPGAPIETGSGARGGAVPVREGPFRDATGCHRHLPSPCRPEGLREPASLWARARAPRARGSAVTHRGGAVGLLGAGPAGRGAPGRCVLLSTSCDPSKIARSNLPFPRFLEPFSNRFLPGGVPITCGFGESPAGESLRTHVFFLTGPPLHSHRPLLRGAKNGVFRSASWFSAAAAPRKPHGSRSRLARKGTPNQNMSIPHRACGVDAGKKGISGEKMAAWLESRVNQRWFRAKLH